MGSWTEDDIPDLTGRQAVVTGANSGIGFYTALALAEHGANVVMACRDQKRSQKAFDEVSAAATGIVDMESLDLADLDSVAEFAVDLNDRFDGIDILINNAGVMGGPRRTTAQGFELQMGTNHLGHFALTARLWPLLTAVEDARVVSLSSIAAFRGTLNAQMTRQTLIDPQPYEAFSVYSNTKQATLLFSQELYRRADAAGLSLVSVASHPGVSSTNLFNRQLRERHLGFLVPVADVMGRVAFMSARSGAHPSVRAATDTSVLSGEFVGPTAMRQMRGKPAVIKVYPSGRDLETAARLWQLSEEITDVQFAV